ESIIQTIEKISAGHPEISRGVGRFKFSSVTGQNVSEMATERYAHVVEDKKLFMNNAYEWAKANIDKTIRSLLNASLRGL
ncbi:MAG TPA: hypothetical protein VMV86_02550, partial [Methanosarcinales archaeon]|nr:hypothetical protein [Methanosarcinales archaeon]